jgi:hypothetical protein
MSSSISGFLTRGFRNRRCGETEIEALKNYLGRMIDNGQPKGDNEERSAGGKS